MASKNRKEKRRNPTPKTGICALLGIEGKFAKSHLIPQALTSHSVKGDYFIESGRGARPVRRFTSWFDHKMLIAEGEEILSKIDSDGIDELRKHKLIWSGWGGAKKLKKEDFEVPFQPGADFAVRLIGGVDVSKLRLFFLSILWRSLKTKIKEFEYLPRDGVDLDRLGRMIIDGDAGSPGYHSIVLIQMTIGFNHNKSPTYHEMDLPDGDGVQKIGYYRLYMQGLIAHIYPEDCSGLLERMGALFIGGHEKLWVNCRKFTESKQFHEARDEVLTANQLWPGAV